MTAPRPEDEAEAKRLAYLPRKEQAAFLAALLDVARNAKTPLAERKESRRRATVLAKLLRL